MQHERPPRAELSGPPTQGEFTYSSATVPGLALLSDLVALAAAAVIAFAFCVSFNPILVEYYIVCAGFIGLIGYYLMSSSGMYEISAIMRPLARSDIVLVSIASAFLFYFAIALSLKVADIYSTQWIYSFFALSFLLVCTGRVLLKQVLLRLARRRMIGRSLVVLGTGPQARVLLDRMGRLKPYFTDVRGVFALGPAPEMPVFEGYPVLGSEEELLDYARANRIDDVVIAVPWNEDGTVTRVVEELKQLPVNVYMAMDLAGFRLEFRPVLGQLNQLPLFEIVQRPISGWHYFLKRVEDFVLASVLIVVAAPLMLLIAAAIKLDSRGPVFFMQKRLGFNNEEFEIYKFRTMTHRDAPETEVPQARRDDPRTTRIGRILRRSSLDELPQLFNVLEGTMSLVGPRPHALPHNEDYGRQIRGYFARHKVKPGITGWAQVNGLRGETDTLEKMKARVSHDVYYAENWSLLFDLRILVMTAFVVLFQKQAY